MRWVVLFCLVGLTGCAWSRPIYFRNDAAGKIIVCGPFTHRDVVQGKEQACIKRATEEGYVRYRN